ncbi:MAG: DUF5050 domain-containing protein [Bacteroides sp.]|nr:DUF5050 domain-containing protein [Eubacterium sp.]MCM1418720.1 DUF5050 domain-containing protein [Roseburia sp.]MCM1462787.1 DUF5050 domain-containing protein [Bacteroides sp.]
MKNRLISLILSIFSVFAFSGCTAESPSAPPSLPQYGAQSVNDTTAITEQSTDTAETVLRDVTGFYPAEQEELPAILDGEEGYPKKDESFSGFSGVTLLSETPRLGNSQQNLTTSLYCGIVCRDGEAVYYTAIGYDNLLHKKTKQKDEVFLDKTVWGINIVGGQMYCIMNSEAPVQNLPAYSYGDLYRVDLKMGEMTPILATKAISLTASEDKLYFVYDNHMINLDYNRVYECDLNGENITARHGAYLGFIGEYSVGYDDFGVNSCLINENTGEKVRFTDSNTVYSFMTEGEYCYYKLGGSGLYRLDPTNGETIPMMPDESFDTIAYQVSETETMIIDSGGHYIGGYCILDGDAYLVFDEFAFRVTPDGETEVYYTPAQFAATGWYYEGLFWDGETLYTVRCNLSLKRYKLVGLQFTDEEFAEGIKTVKEIELL